MSVPDLRSEMRISTAAIAGNVKRRSLMSKIRSATNAVAACFVFACVPTALFAQEDAPDAAAMAEKMSNPTAAVASLGNNFDFNEFGGSLPDANNQRGWNYLFQASFPFPQASGKNILFRPAVPVLFKQPVFDSSSNAWDDQFELGDIGFDLAYGGTSDKGLLMLYGIVGSLPTATDDAVGTDQWTLGPEFAIGLVRKWGVFGALITHKWDVAGDSTKKTNITGGQYFYAFPIGDGTTQIAAGPSFSYNHELQGEKWSLPLGIGLSETTVIGGRVWKFAVQYWNYIKTPDAFGPEHMLRISITPVMTVPWAK